MISIIIIVKNDRGIENTIKALLNIKKPDKVEIIVVDASTDSINDIKNRYKYVKWIYFTNKLKKKITIPEQRNAGIRESKGSVIVFLDANCIPVTNWLNELYFQFLAGEKIVAGSVAPTSNKSVNTIGDTRFRSEYLEEAPTINLLIDKSVFDIIGFFDESDTFGEDIDLTWRAINSGYRIRYAPKALVYHDFGGIVEQTKRMIRYGSVRPRLYKKHPDKLLEIYKGNNLISLIYPLYIILLPLTVIYRFYPLLILIPLLKNIGYKPFQTTYLNLVYGLGVLYGLFNH